MSQYVKIVKIKGIIVQNVNQLQEPLRIVNVKMDIEILGNLIVKNVLGNVEGAQ